MKNYFPFLFLALFNLNAFGVHSWVGDYSFYSERGPKALCADRAGHGITDGKLNYTSWDRQRALFSNLCFEVHIQGVTDREKVDSSFLDVSINAPYKYPARFVAKRGNNYLYVVSLKDVDPVSHGTAANGNKEKVLKTRASVRSLFGDLPTAEGSLITVTFEN